MNASVDEKFETFLEPEISTEIKDNSKGEETFNGFDMNVSANVNIKKIKRANNVCKKSFSCKYCDKTFAASVSAKIHERIHQGCLNTLEFILEKSHLLVNIVTTKLQILPI